MFPRLRLILFIFGLFWFQFNIILGLFWCYSLTATNSAYCGFILVLFWFYFWIFWDYFGVIPWLQLILLIVGLFWYYFGFYFGIILVTPPDSSVTSQVDARIGVRVANRGVIMRDIIYRPIKASTLVSSWTLRPQGVLSADILQRSFAGYGVTVLGPGGIPTPANRVAQALAWNQVLQQLGLNSPREVCLSYVWTKLISNAMSWISGYATRASSRTIWRHQLQMPTYVQ